MSLTANNHKEYQRVYMNIPSYDVFFNNTCGVKPKATTYKELAGHIAELGNFESVENTLYYIISNKHNNKQDKKIMELLMKNVAQKAHGEVFTPEFLVNEILDEFESRYPDFFANPKHTVLDFAAGCGNLLKGVINRFFKGTRHLYDNDKECMHHILKYQIYAIEYQPNNYKMLCINLDYENLVPNNPHFVCANAVGFDYWDMMYNFDMVFINPPYRISNGKERERKNDDEVYPFFTKLAHNLSKRFVINIIPSKFLYLNDDFTKYFFDLNNVVYMKTFHRSKVCFPTAGISGGILCYISDKKYNKDVISVEEVTYSGTILKGERVIEPDKVYPRSLNCVRMLEKICQKVGKFFDELVYSRNTFGIASNYSSKLVDTDDVYKVLCSNNRVEYILKSDVNKNVDIIDQYKFMIPKAGSASLDADKDGKIKIIGGSSQVVEKDVLFSDTFLCIAHSNDRAYVENVEKYFDTKFVNYFMWNALGTHNISKDKFCFVPVVDFTKEWDDNSLYKYFEFSEEEIKEIEDTIKV